MKNSRGFWGRAKAGWGQRGVGGGDEHTGGGEAEAAVREGVLRAELGQLESHPAPRRPNRPLTPNEALLSQGV